MQARLNSPNYPAVVNLEPKWKATAGKHTAAGDAVFSMAVNMAVTQFNSFLGSLRQERHTAE